ncbi:MAG: hypothetical protein RR335_06960 [Eubacterium sp.]
MSRTKIKRKSIADYLNVGIGTATEDYAFMGAGFKTIDESPNPNVEKDAYVCDSIASGTVEGYEPSFSYDSCLIREEKAVMSLYQIGRDQLTGEEAERDYVRVDLYDPITTGQPAEKNTYKARKFRVAVEVTDISGESAKSMASKGKLNQVGEIIFGKFNTDTRKFTADATTTP